MKRLTISLLILLIIVAAFLFFPPQKKEEEMPKIALREAVILFMEGDVKVKVPEAIEWVDGFVDMALSSGYSLKTGADSWAELGMGKDLRDSIKVKEETMVEFTDLGPVKLNLLSGELRCLVEELEKGSTFQIKTPSAVCGARGTGWDVNTDGRRVVVDAYEEEVFFSRLEEGKIIEYSTVEAGKRGIIEDPYQPIAIEDLPEERLQDWNEWKEDFIQRRSKKEGIAEERQLRVQKKRPKVWVEKLERGDYQLMVSEEEDTQKIKGE